MKPIILKVFEDSDLRCGHIGLSKIARKSGVTIERLRAGEFCLFINGNGSRVKLLTQGGVLVYLRSENKEQIDMEIIRALPRMFNGSDFDFKSAAKLKLARAA